MAKKQNLTKADWQNLAKKLQTALENQIDENEQLEKKFAAMSLRADHITMALFKAQGVIEYLKGE